MSAKRTSGYHRNACGIRTGLYYCSGMSVRKPTTARGARCIKAATLVRGLSTDLRTCPADAKGKGTSIDNCRARSTDAAGKGADFSRSSEEIGVCP